MPWDIKLSMTRKTCLDIPVQHVWYFLYSLTHLKVLLQDQHFHAVREKEKRYLSQLTPVKFNAIVTITVCNTKNISDSNIKSLCPQVNEVWQWHS